jgi:hypothetical protein
MYIDDLGVYFWILRSINQEFWKYLTRVEKGKEEMYLLAQGENKEHVWTLGEKLS